MELVIGISAAYGLIVLSIVRFLRAVHNCDEQMAEMTARYFSSQVPASLPGSA